MSAAPISPSRPALNGLLIVDKSAGWTSHDVVAKVRRILGEKRIGHTGTLDPFATGVLPLCIGPTTRLATWLALDEKVYEATLRLGQTTTTLDTEGAILGNCRVEKVRAPRSADRALLVRVRAP